MIKKLILILFISLVFCEKILIPMDSKQSDHLKAYGIAFWSLKLKKDVNWLLNYRGGSFLLEESKKTINEMTIRGVYFEILNASQLGEVYSTIDENNMDIVLLEKSPKIAFPIPKILDFFKKMDPSRPPVVADRSEIKS